MVVVGYLGPANEVKYKLVVNFLANMQLVSVLPFVDSSICVLQFRILIKKKNSNQISI